MRILTFTVKGGIGKISLAAATGVKLAALKCRTLVMSIDPAHRLAHSFDLETELFHVHTAVPLLVAERISGQCARKPARETTIKSVQERSKHPISPALVQKPIGG